MADINLECARLFRGRLHLTIHLCEVQPKEIKIKIVILLLYPRVEEVETHLILCC